jgi:hypothetical protein
MADLPQRRIGSEIERLVPLTADPAAETGVVLVYVREVDGVQRTLARFPSGTVIIIL